MKASLKTLSAGYIQGPDRSDDPHLLKTSIKGINEFKGEIPIKI